MKLSAASLGIKCPCDALWSKDWCENIVLDSAFLWSFGLGL
jgi:hypothetical protein